MMIAVAKCRIIFLSRELILYFKLNKFVFQICPLFAVKCGSISRLSAAYCSSDSEAECISQNCLHVLWKNVGHMVIISLLIEML
jgi:hypothetical protein